MIAGLSFVSPLSAQIAFFNIGSALQVPTGVSNNGIVVGTGGITPGNATNARAYRWSEATGAVSLGTLPGDAQSRAVGISADGSVIAGWSSPDSTVSSPVYRPFVWNSSTGMTDLGLPAGKNTALPSAISGDGSTVVGRGSITDDFHPETDAFKWTSSGGYELIGNFGHPSGDARGYSAATAVSHDGSVVAGSATTPTGWTIFRATPGGGMEDLGITGSQNRVTGMSGDGSTLIGLGFSRWTESGGLAPLANAYSDYYGLAMSPRGITFDGSIIVGGDDYDPLNAYSRPRREGFIWTVDSGPVAFTTVLTQDYGLGGLLSGWQYLNPFAISEDGRFVTGVGVYFGNVQTWVLDRGLNPPPISRPDGPPLPETPIPEVSSFGATAAAALLGLIAVRARRSKRP